MRKPPKWAKIEGAVIDIEPHEIDAKLAIGREAEREHRGAAIRLLDKNVYDRIRKRAARKGHMWARQRVEYRLLKDHGIELEDWSPDLSAAVGNFGYDCLLLSLSDLFPRTEDGVLVLSDDIDEEAAEFMAKLALRHPVFRPSPLRLEPWFDFEDINKTPFIRGIGKQEQKKIQAAIVAGRMTAHLDAVNFLQGTAWGINEPVLAFLKVLLRSRAGRDLLLKKVKHAGGIAVLKIDLEMATSLVGNPFWLQHNCDFRGRCYPLSFFNYTRPDHVRALFRFFYGARIGEDGLRRLKIATAIAFDENKQASRSSHDWCVEWTEKNYDRIITVAAHPMGDFYNQGEWHSNLHWLGEAADPVQFYACAIELMNANNDPEFVTTLPLHYDARCSGAQHYALLARDIPSAKLTNLIFSEAIEDIYQRVDDRFQERVARAESVQTELSEDDLHALWWKSTGLLGRTLSKSIGVPYLYGADAGGQVLDIYQLLFENGYYTPAEREPEWQGPENWTNLKPIRPRAVSFLTREMHTLYDEELKGSVPVIRKYLEDIARVLGNHGKDVEWISPTGLPVLAIHRVSIITKVQHWLHGDSKPTRHKISTSYSEFSLDDALDAVAPNFVHTLDAAFLVAVANRCAAEGLTLATIHDCFATLAPHATQLLQILREELYQLYSSNNPLTQVHERAQQILGTLPEVPNRVDRLDLTLVLKAVDAFKG